LAHIPNGQLKLITRQLMSLRIHDPNLPVADYLPQFSEDVHPLGSKKRWYFTILDQSVF